MGTARPSLVERFNRARTYVFSAGMGPYLIRSVAGTGAVQFGGMAAGFLVGVQLARGLGVAGYGYYGIAMAVITLATIPGTLGIPKLVTREIAAAQSRKDIGAMHGVLRWADRTSWRIAMAIAIALAIGAAIAWREGAPILGAAILFGAPMIALLPLASIRAGALRGLHDVVLGQLSNMLVRPLAMSILLFVGFSAGIAIGAPTAMALNSVTAVGALALTQFWLTRRLPEGTAVRSTEQERGWLASSIPMALTDAVQSLQQQLSVLVLGILVAPHQVGLFRVSIATLPFIAVPSTVINLVVLPMFSRLHTEGDYVRLQSLVTATALIRFAGVSLLSLPLLLAAGPLLALVFGSSYAPAADTLRILAAGSIIGSAFGPNAALLNMTGHERRVTRAMTVGLVVNVAIIALLASTWGSVGSAIAVFVGQCCWNILLWVDARRRLSIETSILGRFVTPHSWHDITRK
jgi:O-antigen/teichoic acid export membrane protein